MTIDDWRARYDYLNAETDRLLAEVDDYLNAETDRLRAEVERLREDAARARWCEEMKADVKFSLVSTRWHVSWVTSGDYHALSHTDRNAAIDAARGKV